MNISQTDMDEIKAKLESISTNGIIYPHTLTCDDVAFVKLVAKMGIITTTDILKPEQDQNLTEEYVKDYNKKKKELKKKKKQGKIDI